MVRSKQPKRPDPHDPESAFGTKQEAVHLPTPTHRDLDPPGSDKLGLSPEEINQFREKGYVKSLENKKHNDKIMKLHENANVFDSKSEKICSSFIFRPSLKISINCSEI